MALGFAILLICRLIASVYLGLGDGEALYFCYGAHPSLSYLDHPPLVGWLNTFAMGLFGSEVVSIRIVASIMTGLTALFAYLLSRDLSGSGAGLITVLLLLGSPVFTVGMAATTPDAPLSALWLLFTWQLHRALAFSEKGVWRRYGRPLFLGSVLGAAFLSKYTAVCLVFTAVAMLASVRGRKWLRRPSFYGAALLSGAMALPVVVWNIQHDFAGVYHRLIWTQREAGFSLRNVGALVGGQLLYMGPIMLPVLLLAGYRIWTDRRAHPERLVLIAASLPALILTYFLALWSRVAEPHWPAVAYLPLFVGAGIVARESGGKFWRVAKYAIGYGALVFAVVNVLVLTPLWPRFGGDGYKPEYDLGNELRGFPELREAILELNPDGRAIVAGFYTICSQLEFVFSEEGDPATRCLSPEKDDFDIWYPEYELPEEGALFVTDNRFEHDPAQLIDNVTVLRPPVTIEITRGGRWVRRFRIYDIKPRQSRK